MLENNINAYCTICGKGYHTCDSCRGQRNFMPWRTVTDSIEHYKIYFALHGYNVSKDKNKAFKELSECCLEDLEDFTPEIKAVIKEIMDNCNKGINKPSRKRAERRTAVNKDNEQ